MLLTPTGMKNRCISGKNILMTAMTSLFLSGFALAAPEVSPNFPNTQQNAGELLSGLNAPEQGRTAVIAYHGGILYTIPEMPASEPNSDFQVRTWNIANPRAPEVLGQHGLTPHPVDAHGYFKSGENLVLGSNYADSGPWNFVATGSNNTVTRAPFESDWWGGYASRGNIFGPRGVGPIFWSYAAIEPENMVLTDSQGIAPYAETTASWDHLSMTGVLGFPIIFGNRLIVASDQSRTGIATYDISDRSNPILLDVLKTGGPGGYFPELWGEDGELYVVFPHRQEPRGHGFQVADITDMTNMRHVGDYALPGDEPMYVQFQDNYAFMGSHKVDMRTRQSVLDFDNLNVQRPDGGVGVSISQFALPIGNLLVTGGVNQFQGMAIWAHQSEPDTRAPTVGYHIPEAAQTHYPVDAVLSFLIHETLETFTIINGDSFSVRPVLEDGNLGDFVPGELVFAYNDILTFTPHTPLADNTTYRVNFAENGIKDAAGNGMSQYEFNFATGSSVSGNTPPNITNLAASQSLLTVNQSASFTATASDAPNDTLQYRFDFGDGSTRTAWQGGNSIAHSFTEQGHYRVIVQVRDQAGLIATHSTVVTVTDYRPATAPQLHSAPLYIDTNNSRLWVANPDNDTVTVLNSQTYAVLAETEVCDEPFNITQDNTDHVWVSCKSSDEIVLLNTAGQVEQRIQLDYGSGPGGIVRNLTGDAIFVALENKGQVVRFNANSRAQTHQQDTAPTPRALAISRDNNQLLITQFISNRNEGNIWRLSPTDLTPQTNIILRKLGGAAHRDGTAEGKGVPSYLSSVMIAPDGQHAWVTAIKANTDRGLLTGVDLDQDNTLRTIAMEINLASGEVVRAIDLDNSDSASHLSFSPLQDYLFITLQGNNKVMVLDMLGQQNSVGLGSLVASIPTDGAPQGIVIDPTTQQGWVKNLTGRSVSRLDLTDFFNNGSVSVTSSDITTVQNEVLPDEVLQGKTLFYHASDPRMSGEGYISCASCHIGGDSDGRVWDFTGRGEGLRNTTSLLGKSGMAQGNVHWTGNFDEIHDFENDIRLFFGGTGFLSDADFANTSDTLGAPKQGLNSDLDALVAYVTSLGSDSIKSSPHRNPDGTMTNSGVSGENLFQNLNCGSCHNGSQFTDSTTESATLHNVGTISDSSGNRMAGLLEGIDTPTLLGLWDNAPYFHDGNAQTLQDVFVNAGGNIYQAEEGVLAGMGWATTQWTELNNDASVRNGGYVTLITTDDSLTLGNIDGGTEGGMGQIRLRHSNRFDAEINISINDSNQNIILPAQSSPGVAWAEYTVDSIPLNAGNNNQLIITVVQQWRGVDIDEVMVADARQIALAQPHRQVLNLDQQERTDLINYLLQLDAQSVGQNSPADPTLPDDPASPENPDDPEEPSDPETPPTDPQPPVALINAVDAASANDIIIFDALNSYDADGAISQYLWQQLSGPVAIFDNNNAPQMSVQLPDLSAQQTLTFQLTVTDNDGLTDIVQHQIIVIPVEPENQAPIANISGLTTAESQQTVQLSAQGSHDPDGDNLTFTWQQISGSAAVLSGQNSATLSVTLPQLENTENLNFRLTVTDEAGLSASTEHSISVQPVDLGSAPVAVVTGNIEAVAGDWVILDARNSYDADGHQLYFDWQQTAGRAIDMPWPKASFQHFQVPTDGVTENYVFELTVSDEMGLSVIQTINLAVSANSAPVPVISGPDSETSGRYVELDASHSYDVNGHNIHFHWQQVGGTGIDIPWPNSSKLAFHTPVVYEDQDLIFRLTLTDDHGASTETLRTINIRRSYAPVIVVQSNHSASAGEYVSISAAESHDPDGDQVSFHWQQISGFPVDLPWPEAHSIGFHAPYLTEYSTLIFNLTVTDKLGFYSKQEVHVEVSANQLPVLMAEVPTAMESGTSRYIHAWHSHDPEGAPLSYRWQYISGPWVELPEAEEGGFTFTAPTVQETQDLVLQLTITDPQGAQTQQQFTVQIVANLPPVVNIPEWISAQAGEFLVLDASDSVDPEGESVWFYWEQLSGESPANKWGEWSSHLNIQLAEQQTGELLFKVTVTDTSGHATSKEVHLVIQP